MSDPDTEKRGAATAAAAEVHDGMRVGLGTGSTVAFLLAALAARRLDIVCVATSPSTEAHAASLGLRVEPFDVASPRVLDVAIDGADQVAPDGWLVKGAGGAHTREKVVAAAARRFVVIVDSTKPVERLAPPVPVELLAFGLSATLGELGDAVVRDAARSPDGGVLADVHRAFDDPRAHAAWLDAVPGVVGHGLFAPGLVTKVLVGRGAAVDTVIPGGAR